MQKQRSESDMVEKNTSPIERAALLSLIFVSAVVAVPITGVVKGLVLCMLWKWFIVPTFHLTEIPIASAIGIALVFIILTPSTDPTNSKEKTVSKEDSSWWVELIPLIHKPLSVLLFGYILHLFM
jgi:hypothetical protein